MGLAQHKVRWLCCYDDTYNTSTVYGNTDAVIAPAMDSDGGPNFNGSDTTVTKFGVMDELPIIN